MSTPGWREERRLRQVDRQEKRACREAKADPSDLEKRVAAYRVERLQRKAERIPQYQILKGGALCR